MKLSGLVSHATPHCHLLFITCALGWMTGGCSNPEDALSRPKAGPPEPARVQATQEQATQVQATQVQATQEKEEGASDGGIADIVLIPLKTYKKVKTNLNEIQITHQMKNFETINGRKPKDFPEYKKKILDPLRITLPELPQGDRYVYRPEEGSSGELMVQSTK